MRDRVAPLSPRPPTLRFRGGASFGSPAATSVLRDLTETGALAAVALPAILSSIALVAVLARAPRSSGNSTATGRSPAVLSHGALGLGVAALLFLSLGSRPALGAAGAACAIAGTLLSLLLGATGGHGADGALSAALAPAVASLALSVALPALVALVGAVGPPTPAKVAAAATAAKTAAKAGGKYAAKAASKARPTPGAPCVESRAHGLGQSDCSARPSESASCSSASCHFKASIVRPSTCSSASAAGVGVATTRNSSSAMPAAPSS